MSLLYAAHDPKTLSLAQNVFNRHLEQDPRLNKEYDERRMRLMY